MDGLKILYVIDYFRDPNAGTEGQLFELIKGLPDRYVQPHLLVFEESPWLKENCFPCEYSVLGSRSLKSFKTWLALNAKARQFRSEGYSVCHVFFNDPSVICPPVFRMHGIKTLISRRDMGYWYTPFLKNVLRVTGRFSSGAIVNSEAVKRITVYSERLPENLVEVIYNGYHLSDSADEILSLSSTDALVSLKANGRLLMGLVANIRPIKRIGDAIEALKLLRQSTPDLDLVIIGAGDPAELNALAARAGIDGRVHFLGARGDVRACLRYLDIGVLCSESEGFSNAIIEYMRAGLPVVCSDVGGNGEAVIHGDSGYLFPAGDIEAFADCIQKLASNAGERERIGSNAAAESSRRFGMSAMIDAHVKHYRRVLGVAGHDAHCRTKGGG